LTKSRAWQTICLEKLVPEWSEDYNRAYADMKQAAALLKDKNLVWSADLETIRESLASFLDAHASLGHNNDKEILKLARAIIAEENDLTI
jgi:GH24 family phage-related lysozyme (muramidase)